MDCLNFTKHNNKFNFESQDHDNFKNFNGAKKIMHFLPVAKDLLEKLNQLPAVQKITEERKAGNAEFKKYLASYKR